MSALHQIRSQHNVDLSKLDASKGFSLNVFSNRQVYKEKCASGCQQQMHMPGHCHTWVVFSTCSAV